MNRLLSFLLLLSLAASTVSGFSVAPVGGVNGGEKTIVSLFPTRQCFTFDLAICK